MSKKAFDKIAAGLMDATAIMEGRADPDSYRVYVPADVNVKAIRAKLNMTQDQFAARFGFSPGAVKDWEQGRKTPEKSNRVLLTIIDRRPDVVTEALSPVRHEVREDDHASA